ncbi:phosphoenolpyruvate synthase [Candidatus Zinderia endosymbiont of Aphrophora alni]|uniref:phosphoenolpyruvate synthase n=1 Tax=Candidatus Zinderia endosymbiont of Aphrophora alni TaxID=3077951 RepID=UPI0030D2EF6C
MLNNIQNNLYKKRNLIFLKDICINDINFVGGKNASLGEMINKLTNIGVLIPDGFVTTSYAFKNFLNQKINKKYSLKEIIKNFLKLLKIKNVKNLKKIGYKIRKFIIKTSFTIKFKKDFFFFYKNFIKKKKKKSFAIRSSSTLEDLNNASFAGQQETFLNIYGINNILKAIKIVFASLYNNRAISYRNFYIFDKKNFYISVCIQEMVRSDIGISGVMFTLDTESGFEDVILINSNYGLGETIVQGIVNPDEFYVHKTTLKKNKFPIIQRNIGSKLFKMNFNNSIKNFSKTTKITKTSKLMQKKFSLTNKQIIKLSKLALIIEKYYKYLMDIEWSIDGLNKKIYILQARPETIKSQRKNIKIQKNFQFKKKKILTFGKSIGQRVGFGRVKIINNFSDIYLIKKGDILVTDITNPNWEIIMKKTSAIVTNRGGKTCHAAIIARELGVPAIVGCINATKVLKKNKIVTVSCLEGEEGKVYEGLLNIKVINFKQTKKIKLPLKIMINIGNPKMAFEFFSIPNNGIGLTRLEFIINNYIKIHPKVILNYPNINKNLKKIVDLISYGYSTPKQYYIEKLTEGISTIAATFWPKPVIIRFSDFKSNEYKKLLGGKIYEPKEENPMIGFRGVTRYLSKDFLESFLIECNVIKKIRNDMGLTNIQIMIPFIRTLKQTNKIIKLLNLNNLKRFKKGLKIIMMCEIPSNVILANFFLNNFDGFSIGSNDLTQLILGLDRDSGIRLISKDFNEENLALKKKINKIIKICKKNNKYIGICGQGPSDNIFFTKWLIYKKINSISLNPDSVINILQRLI